MTANPFSDDYDNAYGQSAVTGGCGVDLSRFDDDFASAEEPEFSEIPDGKYQTRIVEAKLGATKKTGDPMLTWRMEIVSGVLAGRCVFKNSVITRDTLKYMKADLKRLGIDLPRFSDLEKRLPRTVGKAVEITVKSKDERKNVYFNRVFDIPEGGDGIPF